MARRVSLQGRGVELFFGEQTGPSLPAPTTPDPASGARTRARVRDSSRPRPRRAPSEAELLARLEDRQRLASFTFRFQAAELDQLDAIAAELRRARSRRISKNDVVRLGLIWVLSDYAANRERSLLGRLASG